MRFPLSNEINKNWLQSESSSLHNFLMHPITTMWMFAWALQLSNVTPVKSGYMFIYVVLYAIDRLYSSSFTVLKMKNQLVSISVRIATWFSVIKQLSVELANDKMLFLMGRK